MQLKDERQVCSRCKGAGFGPWTPDHGRCYLCEGTGTQPSKADAVAWKIRDLRRDLQSIQEWAEQHKAAAGAARRDRQRDKLLAVVEECRESWRRVSHRIKMLETVPVEKVTVGMTTGVTIYITNGEKL